jgi:predicted transglutaminase-like cysteine proteinase
VYQGEKIGNLENQLEKLKKDLSYQLDLDIANSTKIKNLYDLLSKANQENALEIELTTKIPKVDRFYSRNETDGEYQIDVRNFFQTTDSKIPTVSGAGNDEKALNALKYVRAQIKYTSDNSENTYKTSEYWAYSYQTLKHKEGDCEDGAILIANIMVKSGIPYYRVRVCAGNVNGGGHAYCVYCRETDNEWVVMDWCYWPNNLPVAKRPTHKQERNYFDKEKNYYVWFSWDKKYTYAKEELTSTAMNDFTSQKMVLRKK